MIQHQNAVRGVRRPLVYGLVYMALSMAIEVVLLVVVRLHIPEDNRVIAPIVLIVAPIAAARVCGYRPVRQAVMVSGATVLLTLALVVAFGRITGISTGLAPPIVLRTLAGYVAARWTQPLTRPRL